MSSELGAGTGYIWLNRIFVKRHSRSRLWRNSDIRLSQFEIWVIATLVLVQLAIGLPLTALLMRVDFIANTVNLWPVVGILSPIVGWIGGRRLAKASPYARFTGENIFDWLIVTSDRSSSVLGRLVGRRVATNEMVSWIDGRPKTVEVIEWLGSARAPYAPRATADEGDTLRTLTLRPQVETDDWVAQVRARRRADAAKTGERA